MFGCSLHSPLERNGTDGRACRKCRDEWLKRLRGFGCCKMPHVLSLNASHIWLERARALLSQREGTVCEINQGSLAVAATLLGMYPRMKFVALDFRRTRARVASREKSMRQQHPERHITLLSGHAGEASGLAEQHSACDLLIVNLHESFVAVHRNASASRKVRAAAQSRQSVLIGLSGALELAARVGGVLAMHGPPCVEGEVCWRTRFLEWAGAFKVAHSSHFSQ